MVRAPCFYHCTNAKLSLKSKFNEKHLCEAWLWCFRTSHWNQTRLQVQLLSLCTHTVYRLLPCSPCILTTADNRQSRICLVKHVVNQYTKHQMKYNLCVEFFLSDFLLCNSFCIYCRIVEPNKKFCHSTYRKNAPNLNQVFATKSCLNLKKNETDNSVNDTLLIFN